jgi:hypothetical protein
MLGKVAQLRLALIVSALPLAIGSIAQPASSAPCAWAGGSGLWTNGGLWSCGAHPGSGDDAAITTASSVVSISGFGAQAATVNLGTTNSLNLTGSTLTIYNGALTNNGAIAVSGSQLNSASGTLLVSGTGTIDLTNGSYLFNNGGINTLGAGQTVTGSGSNIGNNNAVIVNNGVINANVSGQTLTIDPAGGNGGVGMGNGVGTNTNSGFLNSGVVEATGGGSLALGGGLYENSALHTFSATGGSAINLANDVRILNGSLSSDTNSVINSNGTGTQYLQNVTLTNGTTFNITGDIVNLNTAFVNNGTINVTGSGQLNSEGGQPMTISGTGIINLTNSYLFNNGGIDTLGSNQTVTGTASIIANNNAVIVNDGNLAISGGSSLTLDVSGGSGGVGTGNGVGTNTNSGFLNNGTVTVTGSSSLAIGGGLYENATGKSFNAINNSAINFANDVRILNGSLTSDATSAINSNGTGTQYLQNVTLTNGTTFNITGDIVNLNTAFANNGTINVTGSGQLNSEGGQPMTISGTGIIKLTNSYLFNNGGIDTLGSNQTVTGTGSIIANNNAVIANNGNLAISGGSSLTLDVGGGSSGVGTGNGVGTNSNSGFLNNGTVTVTGGSTLAIGGGLYENAASKSFNATNNSAINFANDVRILNGSLSSDANSIINSNGTGTQYLQNVTLTNGTTFNITGDVVNLNTAFVNNGTINLTGSGQLNSEGGQPMTISGTGIINLTNSYLFNNGGIDTLGSNQTVTGTGSIIANNNAVIVNDGNLAISGGSSLTLDVSGGSGGVGSGNGVGTNANSGFLNNGTVTVTGSSSLAIGGGLYENAAGKYFNATNNSAINFANDVRILNGSLSSDANSVINSNGTGTQYLQNVTLISGTNFNIVGDTVNINTGITNNGTINLTGSAQLNAETNPATIGGTGTINLTNSYLFNNGGIDTVDSGQTVNGSGSNIANNNAVLINNGFIGANVSGQGLTIDVAGGSGGVGAGNGVGTNGNAGLLNNGELHALNGGTLNLSGGLYEQGTTGLGGQLFANAGSTLVFNGDASLYNLQAGGVLNGGRYYASGAGATIDLRSNTADVITTIGGTNGTTNVLLQGAGSVVEVTPFGGGTPVTIDQSLTGVASQGVLSLDTRNFTVAAGGGNFNNAGLVFVNNSVFASTSFTNSGSIIADNTAQITAPITNSGTVLVGSGTLTTAAITGDTGTIQINPGATLNLGGTSTAGLLTNNGTLALGSSTITVTSDYQNANFGSGNSFNGRNGVTGSGLINASSATMDLSGSALSGNTLNVGNVRTGGSSSTDLTITNHGTETTLRGAVQNTNAASVQLTGPDFVVGPNGGNHTVTISYTGTQAGSLAGQSLDVVNNFGNVPGKTVNLAGNVYQAAQPGAQPTTITLGASRVGGGAQSATITISNVAPVTAGFNDTLGATLTTGGGFLVNGAGSASTNVAAGSSAPVTLSLGTGTSGAFSNTVAIANTSMAVAGSGLADLMLAGQTVNVAGNVYAPAVASLSGNSVDFGTVRQNATSPTGAVTITNTASGALVDSLLTTVTSLPAHVTSLSAPGALAAGQSGTAGFKLDTSAAGAFSGSANLGFASHDGQLADQSLGSQSVGFTGLVTELANAAISKTGGTGTFSGSGNLYLLNLGTLNANSGTVSADLSVLNTILNSAYSEALGGSFALASSTGYSFSGASFSGLAGGSSDGNNFLNFNTTGLGTGNYNDVLTFNGFSHFDPLTDQLLAPIQVDISAHVNGVTTGAVPEPGIWGMMLVGLGFAGAALRRQKAGLVKKAA